MEEEEESQHPNGADFDEWGKGKRLSSYDVVNSLRHGGCDLVTAPPPPAPISPARSSPESAAAASAAKLRLHFKRIPFG
ncbi:unnamed protein product [Nippostrongylus brasiliensis]|uniref:Uncharacterized protein n=1 Tax=Nippostrongylus brasiliensis TaxID=27835 RepID=A0A0N4YRH6_NIPBR|nr:unnamed protein product [Nippostrongylus brasiliensis]